MSPSLPDHLVALPGGEWAAWRWVCLRGAGLPANHLLRLSAPLAAAAAQRLLAATAMLDGARALAETTVLAELDASAHAPSPERAELRKTLRAIAKGRLPPPLPGTGEVVAAVASLIADDERARSARQEFDSAFEADRRRLSGVLRELAAEPGFREAVLWQNRRATLTGLDALLRSGADRTTSKDREHEDLVARYLQRYCAKNDSIGFFGPFGWARIETTDRSLAAIPGASLLARREVYFEQWCIDALAAAIERDERLASWLAPRRRSFLRIDGATVESPVNGRHELGEAERLVLDAVDGIRPACEIAASLTEAHPSLIASETQVFDTLRELRSRQLLAWGLELPLRWRPETALRSRLDRVGDAEPRARAEAALAALEQARGEVAAAAGDTAALATALARLETTFTSLTGAAPTRHSGATYAARGLVFEDARRDVQVEIGPPLLAAIGPPLALLLASARWLSFEAARAYRAEFRRLHAELATRRGSARVPLSDFWFRAQRLLFGASRRPLEPVTSGLEQRWADLLRPQPGTRRARHESADLAPRVREAFAAPGPGWRAARQHCPDLLIAASGVGAVERGDYEAVLGELHLATNTLQYGAVVGQHPAAAELFAAMARDFPAGRVLVVQSKDWPTVAVRTSRALTTPADWFVETGFDQADAPPDRVLRMGDLDVVEEAGRVLVRSRDGRHSFDVIEFFGEPLSQAVMTAFRVLPRPGDAGAGTHSPRVTIDRLVVARETWSVAPSEMAFADADGEAARYLGARDWATRHGLPRFVFVKAAIETKPFFVDLESPVFVNILAKTARLAKAHVSGEKPLVVTEMLPGLDQLWLPDAAGERYTSELRIVAVDPLEPAEPD